MPKVKATAKLLKKAGQQALDYFNDTGACLFCSIDENDGHEDYCPFYIAPAPVPASPPTFAQQTDDFYRGADETAHGQSVDAAPVPASATPGETPGEGGER